MEKRVLNNKRRVWILRGILLCLLLSYLFTWFSIIIMGDKVGNIHGYHFLTGKSIESFMNESLNLNVPNGMLKEMGAENDKIISVTIWAYIAFISVIVAIASTFIKSRKGPIIASCMGLVGFITIFITIIVTPIIVEVQYTRASKQILSSDMENGFRIMIVLYLLAILFGIIASVGKYKPIIIQDKAVE